MNTPQLPAKVEAYRVSDHARSGTLPRHFGRHMMTVEGRIYDLLREFSADYTGGYRRCGIIETCATRTRFLRAPLAPTLP